MVISRESRNIRNMHLVAKYRWHPEMDKVSEYGVLRSTAEDGMNRGWLHLPPMYLSSQITLEVSCVACLKRRHYTSMGILLADVLANCAWLTIASRPWSVVGRHVIYLTTSDP